MSVGFRITCAAAVASMLAATIAHARSPTSIPGVIKGMHYAQARSKILALGYVPYKPKGPQLAAEPCFNREAICRAYPETVFCAGSHLGECDFLFTKGGKFVEVETINEQLKDLAVSRITDLTQREADTNP